MSRLALVTQKESSSGLPEYLAACLAALEHEILFIDAKSFVLPQLKSQLFSFHPNRSRWSRRRDIRAFFSVAAWNRNTELNGRLLDDVGSEVDNVLQIGGLYSPHPDYLDIRYHLFLTYTMELAFKDRWTPHVVESSDRAKFVDLETSLYRNAEHIFVAADYVRQSLVDDYGVSPEKITVTGMGVDPYFEDNAISSEELETRHSKRLLFVGYTFDIKGGQDVLEAFTRARRSIPDLELTIVGCKPPAAAGLPGVHSLGVIEDRSELLSLYRKADLFVMPSRCDSFGFVFLEAMSQGCIPIVSDLNAMPEIVDHGKAGFVVDPGSVEQLTEVIRGYYAKKYEEMDIRCRTLNRVLTRYTWKNVAAEIDSRLVDRSSTAEPGRGELSHVPELS